MVTLKSGLVDLNSMGIEELLFVQEDVTNLLREKYLDSTKSQKEGKIIELKPHINSIELLEQEQQKNSESLVIESSQNFDPTVATTLKTFDSQSGTSTQECVRTHLYHDSSQPVPEIEKPIRRANNLNSSPTKTESVRSYSYENDTESVADFRIPERKRAISQDLKPVNRHLPEKIAKLNKYSTPLLTSKNQTQNEPLDSRRPLEKQEEYKDELLPTPSQLPPVIYKLTDLRKFQIRKDQLKKQVQGPLPSGLSRPLINMNRNPITLGKWRLQDFIVNEASAARQLHHKKKTRKYHEEKAWGQFQRGEDVDKRYLYMFDNLKDREPEPPGYWRIMWPSTQENEQDKFEMAQVESQNIEDRFHKAVDSRVPVEEREFTFKEELLDEVVNIGCFRYEAHNLGIRNKDYGNGP